MCIRDRTTLEETRAFEEISGYNITSIRDVPIATSGIFDDFMEPKFDRKLFCSFNSDVMLIPAWDLGRTWIGAEDVYKRQGRYSISVNAYKDGCIAVGTADICVRPNGEKILQAENSSCWKAELAGCRIEGIKKHCLLYTSRCV